MLKKFNILHIVLLVLDIAVIPIVGFVQGFDTPATFIATLATVLLAHPLIYLILMLVKTATIIDYEEPRFMPLCMVLTILLGCLIWYCFFHLTFVFADTIGLWYALVLLAFAIPYIIYKLITFVSDKRKKNSKGPRIIKNK